MKKFIFVLMWIQFGFSILFVLIGDLLFKELGYPNYFSVLTLDHQFILFWVLYIAWRVTPSSKQ